MSNLIQTGDIVIGRGSPLVLVSGPCVIEDYETTREIARILKEITSKLEIPFIFKASYDKANRTSIAAFRGPGLSDGLRVLKEIKKSSASRSSQTYIASARSRQRPKYWTLFRSRLFYAARPTSLSKWLKPASR
jgi:3-deoxy-D-arabino-heptulosonate 7-phosphate (DAHP) synthase